MPQNDLELQLNLGLEIPNSTVLQEYLLPPKAEKLRFLGRVICLLSLQYGTQVSTFGGFMDFEVFLVKSGTRSCLGLQGSVRTAAATQVGTICSTSEPFQCVWSTGAEHGPRASSPGQGTGISGAESKARGQDMTIPFQLLHLEMSQWVIKSIPHIQS